MAPAMENIKSFIVENGEKLAAVSSENIHGPLKAAYAKFINEAKVPEHLQENFKSFISENREKLAAASTENIEEPLKEAYSKLINSTHAAKITETIDTISAIRWHEVAEPIKGWIHEHLFLTGCLIILPATFMILLRAPQLIYVPLLRILGFTFWGIRAFSVASFVQIPSTTARGIFAILQSAGMGGYGVSIVAAATRVVVVVIVWLILLSMMGWGPWAK
ncbi:hypothetical protein M501DRAFT_1031034 [Patellaria atrata CBS 101060]|uniref:Uncharacterized protein n=1 Tax=Patellaria atrata CBS 101060 TaxID=1346257 RepID=A0A9P4SCG8_9PEZI|nr:hypothetical protein M501DRAFT_1031034 [Patellaria atrata CBS 101060]